MDDKKHKQDTKKEDKNTDKQISDLEVKMGALEDQLKRAVADYRNLEKRIHEDSLALAVYSKAQLLVRLLPVLDNLDQAVEGANQSESESSWLKGVVMSIKEFRQALSDEGLTEVEASGQFDPNIHEAVDVGEGEDGKILQVAQRGYLLNGKVLRPAKVVVGKKKEDS